MAGIVTNIIQNSLAGFVQAGVQTAGGYAGDLVNGVGNGIEKAGRGVGSNIAGAARGWGDYINDYGNGAIAATAADGPAYGKKSAVNKSNSASKKAGPARKGLPRRSSYPGSTTSTATKALPSSTPYKALPAPPKKATEATSKAVVPFNAGAAGVKKATGTAQNALTPVTGNATKALNPYTYGAKKPAPFDTASISSTATIKPTARKSKKDKPRPGVQRNNSAPSVAPSAVAKGGPRPYPRQPDNKSKQPPRNPIQPAVQAPNKPGELPKVDWSNWNPNQRKISLDSKPKPTPKTGPVPGAGGGGQMQHVGVPSIAGIGEKNKGGDKKNGNDKKNGEKKPGPPGGGGGFQHIGVPSVGGPKSTAGGAGGNGKNGGADKNGGGPTFF